MFGRSSVIVDQCYRSFSNRYVFDYSLEFKLGCCEGYVHLFQCLINGPRYTVEDKQQRVHRS
jgi:hypothetical protein